MTRFRISDQASYRLDEIYVYTERKWGSLQAEVYIRGLFDRFKSIAAREFPWGPIPAEFGVSGCLCRHERHVIYWKILNDGSVGIVTILHERMHQIERFREDWGPS